MGPEQFARAIRQESHAAVEVYTVTAVGEDTVNLAYGDTIIPEVPCARQYFDRGKGDEVKVIVRPGSMFVLGKSGAAMTGEVAWADVTGKPDMAGVTYGEGDPPAGDGWLSVTANLWVKDNALYCRVGAGSGSGGGGGGPGRPDPVVTHPEAVVLWQSGHRSEAINGGCPVQGSYNGYPENRGGWFFGTRIADDCAGKTPAGMSMHLSRRNSGGTYAGQPVHLYLVDAGSPPKSWPSGHDGWTAGRLERGESWHLTGRTAISLPQLFVDRLSSGASGGVIVRSGRGEDYIRFGGFGEIRTTFQ